ncbi:unnamed protein product [Rhizopus stolonifer]
MGESRMELLAWLNTLLELDYKKIEDAGTGAAYCQVMDSIFGDVPLGKVKFDTKHEYEYVANYKILQSVFDKHKIDKIIPVDRLLKCKFQDNLEFIQWIKKYWDQCFSGDHYDAFERREGEGTKSLRFTRNKPAIAVKGSVVRPGKTKVDMSEKKMSNLRATMHGLEKERDFYFGKLREIEILVQDRLRIFGNDNEMDYFKEIQDILYRTEDGFEIPSDGEHIFFSE